VTRFRERKEQWTPLTARRPLLFDILMTLPGCHKDEITS
jgi:hypothetical protein